MKVAIHQPNYLPWLGYLHKMLAVDVFVLLDTVQLPRGKSYCHRVQVKSPAGGKWLTVPVRGKGGLLPLGEVVADGTGWKRKHLKTLQSCYGKAPYYSEVMDVIGPVYGREDILLAGINEQLLRAVTGYLGGGPQITRASELNVEFSRGSEYLARLVLAAGGDCYVTGQGAGSLRYLEEKEFTRNGISVEYQEFRHPRYRQLWGEFLPGCSVVDLLFNAGPQSRGVIMEGGC